MFFAFDRSMRRTDVDGRLHVKSSNISKATVNPYRGAEIPEWQALGLDANRVYMMLRDPDELAKAADTFNNLPLLREHVPVNVDNHAPDLVVGSTGTDARMVGDHLVNSLVIWERGARDGVEGDYQRQLSCGYRYTADMTAGSYKGLQYDGIMRNIVGNHVALVREGRAGPDVTVNDEVMPVALKSRTAIMLHGALAAALRPHLATDAALDLSKPLEGITGETLNVDALATSVHALAVPKFAADKALSVEDVAHVITSVQAIKLAADEKDRLVDDLPAPVVTPAVVTVVPPAAVAPAGVTQDAMDSALAAHGAAIVARMNATHAAIREVEPIVGAITVAMDSAADVYKLALDTAKVDLTDVPPAAYGALVRMHLKTLAMDAAPSLRREAPAKVTDNVTKMFPNAGALR